MDVTVADQIKAVRREIGFRERVYPRRVGDGKMTQQNADYQLQAMRAVLETLERVAAQERLL